MGKLLKNSRMLGLVMVVFFTAIMVVTGTVAAMTSGFATPAPAGPVSQADFDPKVPDDEGEPPVDAPPDNSFEVTPVAYNAPDEMRAVTLIPGKDFFATGDRSQAKVQGEIDAALQKAQDLTMNTVIIGTQMDAGVIYQSENLPQVVSSFDPLAYAVSAAKSRGLYVYCIYNLLTLPGEGGLAHAAPVDASVIDLMKEELSGFIRGYKPDGILLADYENPTDQKAYAGYLAAGGGIGYERYMASIPTLVIETATELIHTKVPGMQAGLLTTAVWANQGQHQEGSVTNAAYTALISGNADVRAFVRDGLVDFVAVEAVGSESDKNIPFKTVAAWWGKEANAAGIPLYLIHGADRMGNAAAGWGSSGELVSQLVYAKDVAGYKGSIFNSLAKLSENPGGATNNLMDYFKDKTSAQFILAQLEMTRPAQTAFTTSEPTVTFQGASDPRNDVTMNGNKVETGETGYFSATVDLKAGANTIKFEHKGKTVTYTITRQINVIDTISPEGTLSVDGGMAITVSAYAYNGASVKATLNGATITLTKDSTDDDNTNKDSNYVKYSGAFTAPAGTSAVQKLGNITVSATYEGYTGSKTGASVSVNKKAVIGSGKAVAVTATDAETFPTSTLDDLSSASCFPLPKGALDYTLGDELVYKDGNTTYRYYILESGQRVYSGDIAASSAKAEDNAITGMTVTSTSAYTDVILSMKQKASYNVTYSSSGIKFSFNYTKTAPGSLNNLTKNPLFKSAVWSGTALTLNFRVSNGMVGYRAYYDTSGNLVLRFHNVPSSLSSAKIVVDPGHGGTDVGALGYLSDYPEKTVNWQIARRLASVLESRGANVLLINTQVSSGKVDLPNRMSQAYSFNPQAFVSVHNNSSTNKSAVGHESYYFYSFSAGLSSQANSALGKAIGNNDRGSKYGLYYVTRTSRFAAVLTEGAFMSNYNEFYELIDTAVQQRIANQLANAVEAFFEARYAGSYPTGTESVGQTIEILPTALALDKATLALQVGEKGILTPTFTPAETTNTAITWTSSNTAVATVSATGEVTAVAVGEATITAASQAVATVKATSKVTVTGKAVTGVTLDKTTAEIPVGGSLQLVATVAPADAANKNLTWSSSDTAVATVDGSGKVTGAKAGTATVTVTTADGAKTASCVITVKAAETPVAGITLNKTTLSLTVGGAETLSVTWDPADATNKNLTWSTSASAVATVDGSGRVTAVGPGTAVITATTADGGKTAACTVTVQAAAIAVTGVTVSPTVVSLEIGGNIILTPTVAPANATNKAVTWSSSDTGVATVDSGGKVTAVGAGSAVITVTTADGAKTDNCVVTVNAAPPPVIAVESVSIQPGDMTLAVGGSSVLQFAVSPSGASYTGAVWSSSDTSVAAVDSGGNVTALAPGTAIITVNVNGKTATATVTVE